jgi:hypothetical protein
MLGSSRVIAVRGSVVGSCGIDVVHEIGRVEVPWLTLRLMCLELQASGVVALALLEIDAAVQLGEQNSLGFFSD